MARPLKSIWIRFGLSIFAAVLITASMFACGLLWEEHLEREHFYSILPIDVHTELTQLETNKSLNHERIDDIYDKYWPDEGPGTPTIVILSLIFGIILGGIAALLSAKIFMRPIASLAETAIRIAQGDLTVRAQSLNSVDEISELIRNFNVMANSLERLEHERKEMIASISHELRTPLTILRGRLHALCDGVLSSTETEHRKLLEHTEHLVRLVEDLNTVSMIEAKCLSLHLTKFDLAAFIYEFVPVYHDRAAQYGINIEVDATEVIIMADRDRIRQVLVNLIENAIRYAASGELLQIRVSRDKDNALLEISDRGPGLPDEMKERIFDPFFRFDNSRSRATGGSGLGLAVVKSLIKQHGGTIEAHDRQGGGASFSITLPFFVSASKV